jgi:hypothetical protein
LIGTTAADCLPWVRGGAAATTEKAELSWSRANLRGPVLSYSLRTIRSVDHRGFSGGSFFPLTDLDWRGHVLSETRKYLYEIGDRYLTEGMDVSVTDCMSHAAPFLELVEYTLSFSAGATSPIH